ncbi:hypothetical protein [Nonomuraea polychroma]|uniref:hypothetical protein n=1 Tax=Nonomuraea polychroma TaxID=46176 RepID=UPI001F4D4451|nr:hypothetical protein [Nonomuraea polychroma]
MDLLQRLGEGQGVAREDGAVVIGGELLARLASMVMPRASVAATLDSRMSRL